MAGVEETALSNTDLGREEGGDHGGLGWKCIDYEKAIDVADRLWHVKKAIKELEELARKLPG